MATERTPLALPRVFFAAQDSRSGCATLLLSDCEADGNDSPLQRSDAHGPLQPHTAIAICRMLAAHHAQFWASTLIPLWRWLPDMNGAQPSVLMAFDHPCIHSMTPCSLHWIARSHIHT